MKKQILIAILFTAATLQSIAQNTQKFSGGITGGISTSSVRLSGIDSRVAGVVQGDNIFGIEGGLFAKINFKPFYFKPAAVIHYKSGMVDIYNSEGMAYAQSDFKMTRLQIPLVFGINVAGPLNAEAGLVYNHVLYVTDQYNGYNANVPKDGVGYRAGLIAELNRFAIGVSYQAIANRAISRGTLDSSDELILSAAYTLRGKRGSAPYGR